MFPNRFVALCAWTALLLFVSGAAAQEATVVRVPLKGPRQIAELRARGIEILAFTREGVDLLVDSRQLAFLRTRPYPATVLHAPGMERAAAELGLDLGDYHTFAEMESVLVALAGTYPSLAQVSSIGTSIQGRDIWALKVSDSVAVDESEPEVLFMGCHHAREIMSVEIPLRFAKYLLENYGSDPTVTGYVDTREIWFIPMVNPDGHRYVERNNSGHWSTWWRLNRRVNADQTIGVDLNRNYSYQWGYDDIGSSPIPGELTYRGTGPFSEPETAAIESFVDGREFTIWLSYHSYGELLLYPWGYDAFFPPDHEVFAELGRRLTQANGYQAGNAATGTIYAANGDSEDWGYGEVAAREKIFAFTPELNSYAQGGFGPPDKQIIPTFNLNLQMNMRVLEYAEDPYRVVGPWSPDQYAITEPYGNAVHRISWSANDPLDPNPAETYEIEACRDPSWITDDGSAGAQWTFDGFVTTGSGHTGSGYHSGSGDYLFNTMTTSQPFLVDGAHETLTFWAYYIIETDYDYAYVELSVDGGKTWQTVMGNITTSSNPHGANRGHGITGSSGGWVEASFSLSAWVGQEVLVRLSYVTDGGVALSGLYADDIDPVPSCSAVETIASGVAGTHYDVVPGQTGTSRYRVRGFDAEADASAWSDSEDYSVATLTGIAAGALRTRLGQNYPNPFNPTTTIPFVVGGRGGGGEGRLVSLRIFDVSGALVATVVDGEMAPDAYEARWNGLDDGGNPVRSGVYFARLVVEPDAPLTRKLVLLR